VTGSTVLDAPSSVDPDAAAMARLRGGDHEALAELVLRYQDELVGFFYHHCWDQLNAEELAQTVFCKIFQARERWQPTARVRTWMYRIAHNAWIDSLRRQRHHRSLDAAVDGSDGPSLGEVLAAPASSDRAAADSRERVRERIRNAVEHLGEGHRQVFVLANHQDLRYHEIAEVLGIPEGTVKSRMHAAVRQLRSELADLVEDEL
jgi:RNA polymerase sigma-70 factor (ECF subfamily)